MVELRRAPRVGIAPVRVDPGVADAPLVVRPGYPAAVRAAGGVPLVFATLEPELAEAFLASVDGLLLPGGGDLHPRHFGEEPVPGYRAMDDDVAEFHLALARAAHAATIPTLGICLGCQVMNVALGGSVIQHLGPRPGAVEHTGKRDRDCRHPVAVAPGSLLNLTLGVGHLEVLSRHHQAVDRLGEGLKATAVAPDTVIEGIEHSGGGFFIGVQWHPEKQLGDAANRRLFEGFLRACGERAEFAAGAA